jgi:hypothetical protein
MNQKVYFISDGEFVKIGKSKNPDKRLREMQTGNPHKLELILVMEIGEEWQYHDLFRSYNFTREWFKIEGELAHFLTDNSAVEFVKIIITGKLLHGCRFAQNKGLIHS